jgi:hypothetical protein
MHMTAFLRPHLADCALCVGRCGQFRSSLLLVMGLAVMVESCDGSRVCQMNDLGMIAEMHCFTAEFNEDEGQGGIV